MSDFVTLGGIGYTVTVADRQVIFEESAVFSCHTTFAFERPYDINDTPGIWYLVHLDASSEKIPVSHLVDAANYCNERFGKSFQPYKGALA